MRDERPSQKVFLKDNSGSKPDWSLLPLSQLEGIVMAFTLGARKYGRENFLLCKDPKVYLAAALRHLHAHTSEYELPPISPPPHSLPKDEESWIPHIDHAICNFIIYRWLQSIRGKSDV